MEWSSDVVISLWPSLRTASTVYVRPDMSGTAFRALGVAFVTSAGAASAYGMEKLPLRVYLWESELSGASGAEGVARPEHDGVSKSRRVATVRDINVRNLLFIVNSFL